MAIFIFLIALIIMAISWYLHLLGHIFFIGGIIMCLTGAGLIPGIGCIIFGIVLNSIGRD